MNFIKTYHKNAKSILWLIASYWKHGKGVVLFGLFANGVIWPLRDILSVYLPQIVVNALEDGRGIWTVVGLMAAIHAVAYLAYVTHDILWDYVEPVGGERVKLALKRQVYDKAEKTDYACIDDPKFYDKYKWAMDNYADKSGEAVQMLNELVRGVVAISALAAIIATVSPWVVLVVAAYGAIRIGFHLKYNKLDLERDEKTVKHNRRLDYIHRLFYMKDYASDLRATHLPRRSREYYDRYARDKVSVMSGIQKRYIALEMAQRVFNVASQFLTMLLIVLSFYRGEIENAAMLITLFMAANTLDIDLWDILDVVKGFDKVANYGAKVREFFDLPSKIEAMDAAGDAPEGAFTVELRDVSFRYTDSGPWILRHLDLTVRAGERLAVVGENGAGKSTLVKLLLRLYDVTEGAILIDGVDVREYDVHKLRERIGAAFQNTNVYAMTFAENITLAHEASNEELSQIVDKLALRGVLEKNGASMDTELTREFDEKGVVLSGGEAQKVAIARLYTARFGMLMLDEPSSALDPIAEYEMNRMIVQSTRGATTLLIAHRLSSVRDMDRIVVIDSGSVAETGTHDELMAQGGLYAEMFEKQAQGYREIA